MNQSISVDGMQVKTKVSSNLMIAETNAEANFSTNDLTQSRNALLEPASTVDGVSFFYHANDHIDASGKATNAVYTAYSETTSLANTGAGKTHADYNFNTRYGISGTGTPGTSGDDDADWAAAVTAANMSGYVAPAYAYVDYTFYLKATSVENNAKIYLSKLDLKYDGSAATDTAWRVALFTEEVGLGQAGSAVGSMTLVSVYSLDGATYYTAGKAVDSASSIDTVSPINQTAVIEDDIDAGVTQRYKVVVRLWLEGEDSNCNNDTYALLTSAWTLDLQINLDTTAPSLNNIND